ncbi:amidase domain-containing protein [Herbivorax sp. ANBcel31]|uniref:amidase domain-containing protein n=1 Tax=Herbivorax sp. ANBcel31 TaxID=3069754 RepID=UPI0027B2D8E2|nr:amidase domain-containing protein [Herbivorax sp. ANBcel31]MDQ2086730.1 amidase domain-containing protein [Herbivorax sp. ANBcel31]
MNYYKKNVFLAVVLVTIIALLTLGNASGKAGDLTNTSNQNQDTEYEIKSVLNKYFDRYFNEFKTLELYDFSDILQDTKSTYLYRSIQEYDLEVSKVFETQYKSYDFEIVYKDININKNFANVELLINLDYEYVNADGNKSYIRNMGYTFTLENLDDKWMITEINSEFYEFEHFKNRVVEISKSNNDKLDSDIISKVKKEKISDIYVMKEVLEKAKKADDYIEISNNQEFNNQDFGILSTSYTYTPSLGRQYAQLYAEDRDGSLFYVAGTGGNCTNFVSQCVWAAYGGGSYPWNNQQTSSDIVNRVRMVNSVWQAGLKGGGGFPAWENAESFWNYTTSSKTVGPNGTGYNNNRAYFNLASTSFSVGDVIQARNNLLSTIYGHSMYVTLTLTPSHGSDYSRIYVSQNSDDVYNRALTDVISSYGNQNCFIRLIKFSTANFNS